MILPNIFLGFVAAVAAASTSLPQPLTYTASFPPSPATNVTGTFSATTDLHTTNLTLTLTSLPSNPHLYPLTYTLHASALPPSGACPLNAPKLTTTAPLASPPSPATRHSLRGPLPRDTPLSIVISSASGHPIACSNLIPMGSEIPQESLVSELKKRAPLEGSVTGNQHSAASSVSFVIALTALICVF